MRWSAGAGVLALSSVLASCGSCSDTETEAEDAGATVVLPPSLHGSGRSVLRIISELPRCDIDHRGLTIDAGTDALAGRVGWEVATPDGFTTVEHDGSTWSEVRARSFDVRFHLPEPTPLFVQMRALGGRARAAIVSLDGQGLGTLRLTKGEIRDPATATTTLPADAGAHTITIRFMGAGGKDEPYADIDWIRIGTPDELTTTFGAPTLRDVVLAKAAIGGTPHESISLRSPGAVRCAVMVPKGGRLRAALAVMGQGEAKAEVRVLRDGLEPVVVHESLQTGGDQAKWQDVDVDLGSFAGHLIELELRSASGTPSGRLLFGDPEVVVPTVEPPTVGPARAVVVVVLSGVTRRDLPPWSEAKTNHLPTLSRLAGDATVFEQHRASTTVSAGSVATLLTGQLPAAHLLVDRGARLPESKTHLGVLAHDASVHGAMFTGVPTTFSAFGFGRGWEEFVAHSPASGVAATAPIDDAATYLGTTFKSSPTGRAFVLVHARGGHPPWPTTAKELAELPPASYTGDITPRTAAQKLASLRGKRNKRVEGADFERAFALQALALSRQDAALGRAIEALDDLGVLDDTLLIVTGDVPGGIDDLFDPDRPLDEPSLALPLYVRFPGGKFGGQRSELPTSMPDVARTAMVALGLPDVPGAGGRDLAAAMAGHGPEEAAPRIATRGDDFSARWGGFVLRGVRGKQPMLCELAVDPTCAFDRSELRPLTSQALFRTFALLDRASRDPAATREPATLDDDTAAALKVWGEAPE